MTIASGWVVPIRSATAVAFADASAVTFSPAVASGMAASRPSSSRSATSTTGSIPAARSTPRRAGEAEASTTSTGRPYDRASDQPVPVGVADGLRPVAQPDLGEHVVDVRLHRGLADHQLLRDLAVGQALGDQPQHLGLP